MKESDMRTILLDHLAQLSATAFCLTGDERESNELVTDCCRIFFLKETDYLKNLNSLAQMKKLERKIISQKIMTKLLKYLYQIGKSKFREGQARKNSQDSSFRSYFKMDLEQRLVVFLKFKLKKNFQQISLILGLEKYQVIQLFYNAKDAFLNHIATDYTYEEELLNRNINQSSKKRDSSQDLYREPLI